MKRKFVFFILVVSFSLTLTSCTSESGGFLDTIEKALGRSEEAEEKQEVKSSILADYYTRDNLANRPNTYTSLKKFLKSRVGLSKYNLNKYDCSEMAAFLECRLEDAGFDTYIAEGPAPWDEKGGLHAWIFVWTWKNEQRIWVPVESADPRFFNVDEGVTTGKIFSRWLETPGIVTRSWANQFSKFYLQYFKYNVLYSSIYDIPEWRLDEYDWWKSFY